VLLAAPVLWGCARAQTPAAAYRSAPCKVAPRIDGALSAGEWDAAPAIPITLRMHSGKGQARPDRKCELRFMNSAGNLYVALRLPDASRESSTAPLLADAVVLAFCRGAEVAAGDDRRAMLPGAFVDKHFVGPGKDADDARRDGQGAMVWKAAAAGGEYFMEWQVPLKSGDPEDISGVPGDRLRFNLVYIDKFSANLEQTELGGVFGVDTDHVKDWGSVTLADQVGAEAPAPAPAWLAKLFPNTRAPGHGYQRLRRLDAGELDAGGKTAGWVNAELSYPGLDGKAMLGQARIFLPPVLREHPERPVPVVHVAGYEAGDPGAVALLAQGYAVSTPHGSPLNPLGRGIHLDQAILHAMRAQAWSDPLRVSIQGGSAGGWMTLMLAADAFPLVWAMPDVPPVHWGYNAAYIGENQQHAIAAPGTTQARLPVLAVVGGIVDQSRALYGVPFESPGYLAASPLAHLETITVPTQVVFSSADMLVPVDQVSPTLVQPFDASKFPNGFWMAMTERFNGPGGKRTLLEALPPQRYQFFKLSSGASPVRAGTPLPLQLPFSRERDWSIVLIDEGAPEPTVGHFKYLWALDREPFRKWAESRGVTAAQLTPAKLRRLMLRYQGKPWRKVPVRPGDQGAEVAGNVLDFRTDEQVDVQVGLTAFAKDDARALHLARLYAALPKELQALGSSLGHGTAVSVRTHLARLRK
jgi:hypothetical protein